jgi:hypothetical protein
MTETKITNNNIKQLVDNYINKKQLPQDLKRIPIEVNGMLKM